MKEKFLQAWRNAGLESTDEQYAQLSKRLAEPHRAYHNAAHILYCLEELSRASMRLPLVELAIWYHDAVYDFSRNAEDKSARFFSEHAEANGMSTETAREIMCMILGTDHRGRPETENEAWLRDIDMSILGAHNLVYRKQYAELIRREYPALSDKAYALGRGEFLSNLLDKPSLYWTEECRARYEGSARTNVQRELRQLREMAA